MSPTLNEICRYMFSCAGKLEEEIKININDCLNLVTDKKAQDYQVLALEKVKDNHYKEILKLLGDIVTNIRKIIYHEEYIRKVDYRKSNSIDDISKCHYSSIQNLSTNCHITPLSASVQNLPTEIDKDVRRGRRKVVSVTSAYSLEAWESYLDNKEREPSIPDMLETANIGRRNVSKRKQKKLVSSTINNLLEDDLGDGFSLQLTGSSEFLIKEESEDESGTDDDSILTNNGGKLEKENEYSTTLDHVDNIKEDVNEENVETQLSSSCDTDSSKDSEDFKPKIVDIVYKKK